MGQKTFQDTVLREYKALGLTIQLISRFEGDLQRSYVIRTIIERRGNTEYEYMLDAFGGMAKTSQLATDYFRETVRVFL
jgi:hypothetical protein